MNAAEKTEAECFRDANVYFDVRRRGSSLELTGKEKGVEKFKVQIAESAFYSFAGHTSNNFHLGWHGSAMLFQYRSDDNKEALDLQVRQNGNIELRETDDTYTGWNEYKTFGVRTNGTLENRSNQAFWFLVASANQIHNYGTINSYSVKLFQNDLFNSGVLQFGVMPTGLTDLSTVYPTDETAVPSFKQHTIENYGTFKSNGKFRIKDGLHYVEHGSGDFENLETSNGNMNISAGKSMNVSGSMTGQVGSLFLGDNSSFSADRIGFSQLQNFTVGTGSSFHSPNTYNISVNGSFANSGEITSGADMSLYLKNVPTTRQSGIVLAKGNLNYTHEQSNRPRNSTRAPDITKDPIARAQLLRTAPDPNSWAFKRLQAEFYRRKGYNPDADNSGSENPIRLLAKKIRQTIYTDHYLNTITYHYTIYRDQYGREVRRELTDVTETGYVWQRRTQETREITVPIPAELNQALDNKSQSISMFKRGQDARIKLAQELERATAGARKAEMHRRFLEALRKAMTGAGASDPDVQALLSDPYFNALTHFDDLPPTEQTKLTREHPKSTDLLEAMDDARYDVHDLTRWLDAPTRRFIDDYVIPMMTIASCFIPGTQAVTIPRAIAVAVPRMVPLLGRVAITYGAWDIYRKVTTFFSENFSGGKDKGKANSQSGRIQSTQQDADRYLKRLTDQRGLINYKGRTQDGYEYYEFMKKTTYNGVRFRKGDFISRDTLHHEWEWFRGVKDHKGPINSKTGKVNTDKASRSRVLKVK